MNKQNIRFTFHCDACARSELRVLRFNGMERLGRPYEFTLHLAGKAVDLEKVLYAQAVLQLHAGNRSLRYAGCISAIEEQGVSHGAYRYRATLSHDLARLAFSATNALFVQTPVPEIITRTLQGIASQRTLDFVLKLKEDYPARELVCRYRENNLQFLQRIVEQAGIYYFFEQADAPTASNRIIFADTPQAHPQPDQQHTFAWHEAAGLSSLPEENVIQAFELRQRATVEQVLVDDYNPAHPALPLSGQAGVDSPAPSAGARERFYGGAFSQAQAQALAAVRAQALACHAHWHTGALGAPLLSAGQAVTLTNHPLEAWNADYLVTSVRHEGTQPADGANQPGGQTGGRTADPTYRAVFGAIPADQPFKLLWSTPKPRISGVVPGRIQAEGSGTYAELDADGCYKLLLPFGAQGSKTPVKAGVRMLQPYGGTGCGLHFPLHKDAEVLVAFLHGDPDRPVIVGAVPNCNAPSMVTSDAAAAHRIRTHGGNLFQAHDAAAHNHLLLGSPTGDSSVLIGEQPAQLQEHHEQRVQALLARHPAFGKLSAASCLEPLAGGKPGPASALAKGNGGATANTSQENDADER